ncbi:MAG: hypothetical protein AAGC67_08870 [Myxococcota bacterium]
MARITILDPTAPPPEVDADPGPALRATDGVRFGLRYDLTWRSFDWVREEWAGMLAADGGVVGGWCAGDRTGEAAEATLGGLRDFLAGREVLISGLGN